MSDGVENRNDPSDLVPTIRQYLETNSLLKSIINSTLIQIAEN